METRALSPDELSAIKELTEECRRKIPEVLLPNTEVARLLGVTPNTIGLYIRQKRLSKTTIDGVTGILLRDVVCFKRKNNPQ